MRELAEAFLAQGSLVRAAALMMKLTETEPTAENLELLAEIYMQQGLHEEAAVLYLRVVKAEQQSLTPKETLRAN